MEEEAKKTSVQSFRQAARALREKQRQQNPTPLEEAEEGDEMKSTQVLPFDDDVEANEEPTHLFEAPPAVEADIEGDANSEMQIPE